MDHRWNDPVGGGGHKYSEKNLSLFLFIDHKSHTYWPGIKPEASSIIRRRLGNYFKFFILHLWSVSYNNYVLVKQQLTN